MSKYRVYELAKEFNKESKDILDVLKKENFQVKNNFSSVGDEERNALKKHFENKKPAGASYAEGPPQNQTMCAIGR